ncbi:MAG: FkbM family methyltransferase [bacterium]|nr:FkbM family methyltransferase [bacterium]
MIRQFIGHILADTPVGAAIGWTARATHAEAVLPDRVRALLGLPVVISVTLPDGRTVDLHCPGPQDEVAGMLQWRGFEGYEPETTALFYRLCEQAECVYDVGAHTGYYALLAAAANPQARVYAFEPAPSIYDRLEANVRLNGFDNIHCQAAAAEADDGFVELYVPPGNVPSSASTLAGFREAESMLRVPAVRLDTHAAEHAGPSGSENDLQPVDLVKMDVEATEHHVLAGMTRLLETCRPVIVSEVLYNRNERQQQAILERHGYRWFWITDRGLVRREEIVGDQTYQFRNYVYIHSNSRLAPEVLDNR